VELAGPSGGEVFLLHVIEVIPGLSMKEERAFYNRLERMARSHLDRWGKRLEERKVAWRAEVLFGNRAPLSVQYATEVAADLIILTAPQLNPATPGAGWGSMSYKVGLLSRTIPVLLIKEAPSTPSPPA
jgi:hypothetical protein